MTSTPPGWYDDGYGALRWWDGSQWTEHVATPDPETVEGIAGVDKVDAGVVESTPGDASAAAYPGGYPPAYPGADGVFLSATEPRKSKRWIVWVVLGVVLLGIVITLAVLIPIAFLRAAGGSSPQPTVYSEADHQQAVAAVELYDQALRTADCDAYFTATTEAYRELFEVTDCDSFLAWAAEFDVAYEDYEVVVDSVTQNGAALSVFTTETYLSIYDDNNNETAEPQAYEDEYEYIVVPVDGGWAIDDAFAN